jgi:hypothetical protein
MGTDVSVQEQKEPPHPEERPLGRVSKDEVDGAPILRDAREERALLRMRSEEDEAG